MVSRCAHFTPEFLSEAASGKARQPVIVEQPTTFSLCVLKLGILAAVFIDAACTYGLRLVVKLAGDAPKSKAILLPGDVVE